MIHLLNFISIYLFVIAALILHVIFPFVKSSDIDFVYLTVGRVIPFDAELNDVMTLEIDIDY